MGWLMFAGAVIAGTYPTAAAGGVAQQRPTWLKSSRTPTIGPTSTFVQIHIITAVTRFIVIGFTALIIDIIDQDREAVARRCAIWETAPRHHAAAPVKC